MDEMFFDEAEMGEDNDAVILALGEMIETEETKTAIINPRRFAQMRLCYELIQKMMQGSEAEVNYRLHEPFKSMGSITLEADNLIIQHPEVLRMMCALCSNAECYPLTNGKIRMVFAFDRLTIPME